MVSVVLRRESRARSRLSCHCSAEENGGKSEEEWGRVRRRRRERKSWGRGL